MYAGFLLFFFNSPSSISVVLLYWQCGSQKQTKQSYSTRSSCLNINNASILSGIETGFVVVCGFFVFVFFSSGRTRQ